MAKPKNYYIKYKRTELEEYVQHPESCVKKINKVEKLIFGSNVVNNFKESILRILSRKIGKYDRNLEGVVLDFRNTKILNMHTGVRYDSAYSAINVETNFYIFQPRKDAIVKGIVKHINAQKMETIITVVIYRVFNVKVTFKGCLKQCDVYHNKEIEIRIKEFHFDNEIPYIEGEMINKTMINTRKTFDDVLDSGISENRDNTDDENLDNEYRRDQMINVKQERESSTEPSISTAKSNKPGKRKLKEDSDDSFSEPPVKKIKEEPISDDDFTNDHVNVKAENSNDSEAEYLITKKDKKKKNKKSNENSSSTKDTTVKKKKKKRKAEDDFESSLQMILNSSLVKQEKY